MSATVTGSSRSRSSSDSAVGGGPGERRGRRAPGQGRRPSGAPSACRGAGAGQASAWAIGGRLGTAARGARRGRRASGAVGRGDAHHAPLRPFEGRERIAIQLGGAAPQVLPPFELDDAVVEGVCLQAHAARPIIQNIGLGLQIAGAVRRRGDRQRPGLRRPARAVRGGPRCRSGGAPAPRRPPAARAGGSRRPLRVLDRLSASISALTRSSWARRRARSAFSVTSLAAAGARLCAESRRRRSQRRREREQRANPGGADVRHLDRRPLRTDRIAMVVPPLLHSLWLNFVRRPGRPSDC